MHLKLYCIVFSYRNTPNLDDFLDDVVKQKDHEENLHRKHKFVYADVSTVWRLIIASSCKLEFHSYTHT